LRFLIGGGSAAALNLLLAYVGVDLLGFRSDLQQNYVNFAAMETSLIYSFFVYRAYVWKDKGSSMGRVLLRQLPLYHLSAGAALLGRVLLFPVLQAFGVHYLLNIVLGILAGAAINYVLSDRYVFKDPVRGSAVEKSI
jgi:dolichol-phosphate mannosyltransferase